MTILDCIKNQYFNDPIFYGKWHRAEQFQDFQLNKDSENVPTLEVNLSKGKAKIKKTENMWSSSFIRGTKNPKDVLVCVAPFWRKMVTMPVGYFSLVALYYCKMLLIG